MTPQARQLHAVEPPATGWMFPSTPSGRGRRVHPEVVGLGADLEPGTLLAAYRGGVFPMPVKPGLMAWWSPDPRGIIPLDGLKVSRSLRRSCARYQIRVDTACPEVIEACADPDRSGRWIDDDIQTAYRALHEWGWVHSVEAWDDDGQLAGGLYGVCIGGFFAGESMFHRQTDASKVALVALVDLLREGGASLLDVQWATSHLGSLGAVEVARQEYLELLARALDRPQPAAFGGV